MPIKDLKLNITGDSSSAEAATARADAAIRRHQLTVRKAQSEMAADFAKTAAAEDAAAKKRAEAAATVGRSMIGIGLAAGAAVALSVAKFAQFDEAMSHVEAATHETAEGMEELRAAALKAGADTAFSATEAAAGVEELAKAGLTTADIVGGALTGALNLAAAGGIAVAEAAETTATALNVFNLQGSQASHVADLLAAGAGKAQGTVSDMGMALNQSALVAKQMGLSVEDTAGSLALFASNGLLGSDAGTSFRTMLLRLSNPSNEAKAAMDELGISVYNAQGQFIGMDGVADQLQTRMAGLDQETRNAALATIFGSDAIRAAGILYDSGAKGVKDWTDNVNDAGYAAETAAIRMDNLKGDLEKLSGSFDTAMIGLGEAADGPLRSLVQGLTDAVNGFANMPEGAQAAALAVAAVTAAVTLLGGAALVLIPKINATRVALTELGVTAGVAAKGMGIAAKAAGVLAAAWVALEIFDKIDPAPKVDELAASLRNFADTGDIKGAFANIDSGLFGTVGKIEDLQAVLKDAAGEMNNWWDAADSLIGQSAGEDIAAIDDALAEMVNSGNGDEAARIFASIAEQARAAGLSAPEIEKLFDAFAAAGGVLSGTRDVMDQLTESTGSQRQGIEGVGAEFDKTTPKAEALREEYEKQVAEIPELSEEQAILRDRLGLTAQATIDLTNAMSEWARQQEIATGGTVSAIEAVSRYEESVDRAQQTFDDYTAAQKEATDAGEDFEDALDEANGTLDLHSEAGRAASDSILAMRDAALANADAIIKQTADQELSRQAIIDGRQSLYDMAIQYGLSEDAAWLYVDSILAIPPEAKTVASFEDALARKAAGEYSSYMDWATRNRTTSVYVEWYQSPGPLEGSGYTGEAGGQSGGRSAGDGSYGSDSYVDGGRAGGASYMEQGAAYGSRSFGSSGMGGATTVINKTMHATVINPVGMPTSESLGRELDKMAASL